MRIALSPPFLYRWFAMPAVLLTLALAPAFGQSTAPKTGQKGYATSLVDRPKNLILFISDGAGPVVFTMARDYLREQTGRADLALDSILVGSSRTRSTDSRTTDSAAGATAYSTGVKTYNAAIAVDDARQPVRTILEAAEARGMATGTVSTSRVTHATPAAFAAHVEDRDMEDEIAVQQLAGGIDVLFGGGYRFFLPAEKGGTRKDGRDLLEQAAAAGTQVLRTRSDFERPLRLPVVGLFTPDNLTYEIDRNPAAEPSLSELTEKAIALLSDDPDGFFLMVEGSRIDHAAHANDPAAVLHETLEFERAVQKAPEFARRDGRTLVVSTSDHETGGLALGRRAENGERARSWDPVPLARVRMSADLLAGRLAENPVLSAALRMPPDRRSSSI